VADDWACPGEIALTRMPSATPSAASDLVIATTPPFAAAWATRPIRLIPRTAETDAVLTIEPRHRAVPPGRTRVREAISSSTSMTSRESSRFISVNGSKPKPAVVVKDADPAKALPPARDPLGGRGRISKIDSMAGDVVALLLQHRRRPLRCPLNEVAADYPGTLVGEHALGPHARPPPIPVSGTRLPFRPMSPGASDSTQNGYILHN
jgi:hypothetical protein